MSWAPRVETHAPRAPVGVLTPSLAVLHVATPSSGPESGVPFAATCHSALVGSRLPALAHASAAWNHVTNADGLTAGRPASSHGA